MYYTDLYDESGNPAADASIMIASTNGPKEYERADIVCANRSALFSGWDAAPTNEKRGNTVTLLNCRVRGPGKWGVFHYQTNLIMKNCILEDITGEHADYGHGCGGKGGYISGCKYENIAGECCKRTYRPAVDAYGEGMVPGKHAAIDGVPFHSPSEGLFFGSNWCKNFGGGVVLQGSGMDALVHGCVFEDHSTVGRHPCVGTEHGGEFYAKHGGIGIPGRDFGNGHLVLEQCIFYTACEGPILYLTSCESVLIKQCGIYGPGYITHKDNGSYRVEDCNTPAIDRIAQRMGIDISQKVAA